MRRNNDRRLAGMPSFSRYRDTHPVPASTCISRDFRGNSESEFTHETQPLNPIKSHQAVSSTSNLNHDHPGRPITWTACTFALQPFLALTRRVIALVPQSATRYLNDQYPRRRFMLTQYVTRSRHYCFVDQTYFRNISANNTRTFPC